MYYHNLNVIRKGSKKLLTIKNSKSFFLTPSTYRQWGDKNLDLKFFFLCSGERKIMAALTLEEPSFYHATMASYLFRVKFVIWTGLQVYIKK